MIRFSTLGGIDLVTTEGRKLQSVLAQPKRVALLANAPFLNADPDRLDRLSDNLARLLERHPLSTLAFRRDSGFWPLLTTEVA